MCLGEGYCHGPCFAMLHFSIHTMFDLEHPFAKNKFPTLGKRHQHPNVVGNKIIVLFLHNNLSFFCIFTFQLLPHFGVFFEKVMVACPPLWWQSTNHEAFS
jgi:hypothetical protein